MSWFLVILLLSLTFGSTLSSEVRHENKTLPSAVIVGTVYCDTCFQENFSMKSRFITGAYVVVECKDGNSNPGFREEVKTKEHGEFRFQLPSSISKHLKKIKGCAVKLINSSDPYCSVASSAASSIHLKSRKQGKHIFSAGFFSFKPLQQPTVCNQKLMSIDNSEGLKPGRKGFLPPKYDFRFPPSLQNPIPSITDLPPLPSLPELPPLPQVPALPHLPRLPAQFPFTPFPGKSKQAIPTEEGKDPSQADFFFPPNPLQPPPLIPNPLQPPPLIPNPFQPPPLIPNPFQPPPSPLFPNPFQPPPSPLIPNPFQPPPAPLIPNPFQPPSAPPAPLFPFPPIPGFTPSPPPPPPPAFPFIPLPPLFPGRPPASPSTVRNSP